VFGDPCLHFYGEALDARADQDADLVARFIELAGGRTCSTGRLVIDLLNRDVVLRRMPAGEDTAVHGVERGDDLLVDRTRLDAAIGRWAPSGSSSSAAACGGCAAACTLRRCPELQAMLAAAAVRSVDAYDEDGEPFASAANRLVVVARR
jgi:hypothetical protein